MRLPAKRQLEMEFVDAPHAREIGLGHRLRRVIDRRPREPQEPRLTRNRQPVRAVDHRFPLGPRSRLSAWDKKSRSRACCPIFACSALTSIDGSRCSLSPPNASAALATSCRRHSVIWFRWTSKRCTSSASVWLPSSAAKAAFALNAAEWFRRGRRIRKGLLVGESIASWSADFHLSHLSQILRPPLTPPASNLCRGPGGVH